MQTSAQSSFRKRLVSGAFLAGSFVKTPSPHATEILGDSGFDFIVVDQEHAPFDRVTTDLVLLAARAAGIAGVVRVPTLTSDAIQASLDCGAVGILARISLASRMRRRWSPPAAIAAASAASPALPAPAAMAAARCGTSSTPPMRRWRRSR